MKNFLSNELVRLFLYVILCLVLAAIFTPSLYIWGKSWAAENKGGDLPKWLESLRGSMERGEFARYFNRVFMASAIVLLYPLIRSFKRDTGEVKMPLKTRMKPGPQGWKDMFVGFVYAAGYMGFLLLIVLNLGWLEARADVNVVKVLRTAAITAVVVALLEEWLFRGVLYGLLRRSLNVKSTIIGLSLFYAAVHFLKPHSGVSTPISQNSGFELLGQIGLKFLNFQDFVGVFLTLFAVGAVLGYARWRTGYVWLSVGLHAGWVFCMFAYKGFLKRTDDAVDWMFGLDIREGVLPMTFVILTGFAIWFYLKPKKPLF